MCNLKKGIERFKSSVPFFAYIYKKNNTITQ